jgi:hypothetical protein
MRTGKFIGVTISYDTFKTRDEEDVTATCYVHRSDSPIATSVTVFLSEYAQDTPFWRRMPKVMLGKVAEVQALRRAFPYNPETKTGIPAQTYVAEEMTDLDAAPPDFAKPKRAEAKAEPVQRRGVSKRAAGETSIVGEPVKVEFLDGTIVFRQVRGANGAKLVSVAKVKPASDEAYTTTRAALESASDGESWPVVELRGKIEERTFKARDGKMVSYTAMDDATLVRIVE